MKFSSWPVSVCSLAATIPMAMDGSKLGPSFFTSAGRQGQETGISWAVSLTGQAPGCQGHQSLPGRRQAVGQMHHTGPRWRGLESCPAPP